VVSSSAALESTDLSRPRIFGCINGDMVIPVEPKVHDGATLVKIAESQDEYTTLPALVDKEGVVMTEWELTAEELLCLRCGGRIRLWIHTFNNPLQPVNLEAVPPEAKES
jgi:hypothetical protein